MTTEKSQVYQRVKSYVLQRVRSRRWPPGHLVPNEVELARTLGCARATVNRAMRELADEGVINRKRKAGTRIATQPVRQARFAIPLIRSEIESGGHDYGYRLLSRAVLPAPLWLSNRLALAEPSRFLHVRCLHLAQGNPHTYEDRWINLETIKKAEEADFSARGPNEWLVSEVPFSRAEFRFMAEKATASISKLLASDAGSALMVAERVTWLKAAPITFARLHFSPGYSITTRV